MRAQAHAPLPRTRLLQKEQPRAGVDSTLRGLNNRMHGMHASRRRSAGACGGACKAVFVTLAAIRVQKAEGSPSPNAAGKHVSGTMPHDCASVASTNESGSDSRAACSACVICSCCSGGHAGCRRLGFSRAGAARAGRAVSSSPNEPPEPAPGSPGSGEASATAPAASQTAQE